jgi:pentapeptide MXKDX repeat protein
MINRLMVALSAATLCFGLALAPAFAADEMAKPGAMSSGAMSSDKMTKPDTMGKTDTMAKPGEKADTMKKPDAMSDKTDKMSDPMNK